MKGVKVLFELKKTKTSKNLLMWLDIQVMKYKRNSFCIQAVIHEEYDSHQL